jgi:hypothetical protein
MDATTDRLVEVLGRGGATADRAAKAAAVAMARAGAVVDEARRLGFDAVAARLDAVRLDLVAAHADLLQISAEVPAATAWARQVGEEATPAYGIARLSALQGRASALARMARASHGRLDAAAGVTVAALRGAQPAPLLGLIGTTSRELRALGWQLDAVGRLAGELVGQLQLIGATGRDPVVAAGAAGLSPPGEALRSVEDVLANPHLLAGRAPDEVAPLLAGAPGWRVESLGRGHRRGQGWVLRHYNESGEPTGMQIRWHPGGGHHGRSAYWRVVGASGDLGGIIR